MYGAAISGALAWLVATPTVPAEAPGGAVGRGAWGAPEAGPFGSFMAAVYRANGLCVHKPERADSARHSPEIIFLSPQSCSASPNHQQPFFIPGFADIDF